MTCYSKLDCTLMVVCISTTLGALLFLIVLLLMQVWRHFAARKD